MCLSREMICHVFCVETNKLFQLRAFWQAIDTVQIIFGHVKITTNSLSESVYRRVNGKCPNCWNTLRGKCKNRNVHIEFFFFAHKHFYLSNFIRYKNLNGECKMFSFFFRGGFETFKKKYINLIAKIQTHDLSSFKNIWWKFKCCVAF